jgi:type I restriction enzyme M protein
MIWSIKELIRDDYNDKDVDQVILPFTLLRRLDCVLEDKQDIIKEAVEQVPEAMRESLLPKYLHQKGVPFYNLSGLTLNTLLQNPVAIADNFKTYLEGFSANIKDILYNFTGGEENGLSPIYATLARKGLLYKVTQEFCIKADLHPSQVDNHTMGTVFETIIRYSKESTNEAAGQFYTPREIVRLLVRLVMCGQEERIYEDGQNFSLYDPACGTGGMLTVAKDYLSEQTDRPMLVRLYGQEINEQTYAICKSDILMKDEDAAGIYLGNTLTNDHAAGKTFNYMISNPPFGVDWKKSEEAIRQEAEDPNGRFAVGLPSTSDGSLLFLMHMIHKMDPSGARIGIVLNGSPLFNGDAGSGWSNIRKSLLDRDLLDTIVALPKNLFYGADISSYLWILDNRKPESHRGKVLFINASTDDYATPMQRSLGKKRYEISDASADKIIALYRAYASAHEVVDGEERPVAKLLDSDDFLYTKVTVQRPLRLRFEQVSARIDALLDDTAGRKVNKKDAEQLASLRLIDGIDTPRHDAEFFGFLAQHGHKRLAAATVKKLRTWLGTVHEDAPEVYEKPGDPQSGRVADTNLTDTESIPMKQDIDAYFRDEVLRFVPDAWMEREKDKVGCEFPFTRLFYQYRPLRSSEEILAELEALDREMDAELSSLKEA